MQHSDQGNVRVVPFMHSPNNSAQDANAVSFNVLWPVKDITVNEGIYKDYLAGYTEERFRSARLHTWFDVPDQPFTNTIKALRAKDVVYDVEGEFNRIQENHPLRGALDSQKVKVYTEDHSLLKSLNDSRFELVS